MRRRFRVGKDGKRRAGNAPAPSNSGDPSLVWDTPGAGFGKGEAVAGGRQWKARGGGGAVFRFGKEGKRRVGTPPPPAQKFGRPLPQLWVTIALDLGWEGRWIWGWEEGSDSGLGEQKGGK